MEVEDKIELADVAEVFVKYFHKGVDELKHNQLVVALVDDCDEVETGVTFVNYLVLLIVDEVAHLGFAGDHQLIDLHQTMGTSLRNRCFSCWDMFDEYHLVSLERPCLLIKKKQWSILV